MVREGCGTSLAGVISTFVFDVLRIAGGSSRFVGRVLHPLPPPGYWGVVKFSQRCCCVLKPTVILCHVSWKLITDVSKNRQFLEKSLSLTSFRLTRPSITEALKFHDRVSMNEPSIFSYSEPDETSLPVKSLRVHIYLFKIHFTIIPSSPPSSSTGSLSFLSGQILYALLNYPTPCTFLANLRHQIVVT